jgi:hypothetical protein
MKLIFSALPVALSAGAWAQGRNPPIYDAGKYQLYRDSIVQSPYVADAISSKELSSNYRSAANEFRSAALSFKFSINGKDNEMRPGTDHHFMVIAKDGRAETPLIRFGTQLNEKETGGYMAPNTKLTIRLDMRDVMNAFNTQGYYTTYKGDKIYKSDFKGVFVAGNAAPLTWDFDNLVNHSQLQLHDEDGDGIYEVTLSLNTEGDMQQTAATWKQSRDLSAFPSYNSSYTITNTLYNLAMEEMVNAVEPDSTFRTGKEWAGVWTRDISYSIILSMAHLQPAVAKKSLLRKVNGKKKIIQDTGTGGAWPASTDRMIWAVAAWELYKVTGDNDWLQQAYTIVKNSIDDDMRVAYDPHTGLVKGESSFLDWREQTYPKWMQPVDIAESECLGTNAVHYEANVVLAKMAAALHHADVAAQRNAIADRIKNGINTYLWQPAQQYYAQYLYGRNYQLLSPRAEALGEALAVIFDIAPADRRAAIVAHTPVTDYGISCIYPQIPDIPPYHNNAVWPFVQTYWLWAAAKAGNEKSALESMAAIYRPPALFATNKENFVADNGDFLGTQINSSNMLWSLSGNISIVHKVLFGIRFNEDGLSFEPFVPRALSGKRSLNHFTYRGTVLDIEMTGFGNRIKEFWLDGEVHPAAFIPATLEGNHSIRIVLANNELGGQSINKVANHTTLPTPDVSYSGGQLSWTKAPGTKTFQVLKNGQVRTSTAATQWPVSDDHYAEYQVVAIDAQGFASFASEPVATGTKSAIIYELENFTDKDLHESQGYSGSGFAAINTQKNTTINIPITVTEPGFYALDFRYANGNGPTNTENKCALRSLRVDGKAVGTSLFPQRGKEEWSNWGFSNAVRVQLPAGAHTVTLVYEEWNENMNGSINEALLDYLRVMKIAEKE